jgi:hypothetical protein
MQGEKSLVQGGEKSRAKEDGKGRRPRAILLSLLLEDRHGMPREKVGSLR